MQDPAPSNSVLLLMIVLAPFVGSVIAALLPANARNREAWLAGFIAFIALVISISLYGQIGAGQPVRFAVQWMPMQGVEFALRMDGLAWAFSLLITAIGILVVLYARYYMSPADP
ncbi:MAG: monovalent cation/H+ antiporter subunit A, partial [Burkholderiaceae bacterium]|nr:monovalent cation/H+ antiporter subunit A [Burkholderiaceae bacterium]